MQWSSFSSWAAISSALWLLACSHPAATQHQADAAASASSLAPSPVDRLEHDEIAEGTHEAFALRLPRDMQVSFRGPDVVEAWGWMPAEAVANYVRRRVVVSGVELGTVRTVFDHARVRGEPTGRPLRVEVISMHAKTKLIVVDQSPPLIDPNLTPEQRWRKFGFDKNGNLIDPTHLE